MNEKQKQGSWARRTNKKRNISWDHLSPDQTSSLRGKIFGANLISWLSHGKCTHFFPFNSQILICLIKEMCALQEKKKKKYVIWNLQQLYEMHLTCFSVKRMQELSNALPKMTHFLRHNYTCSSPPGCIQMTWEVIQTTPLPSRDAETLPCPSTHESCVTPPPTLRHIHMEKIEDWNLWAGVPTGTCVLSVWVTRCNFVSVGRVYRKEKRIRQVFETKLLPFWQLRLHCLQVFFLLSFSECKGYSK